MTDLITRITAAHQMAIGQMENATRQDEHLRWKGIVRVLEDARDEITRLSTFERILTTSAQAANPYLSQLEGNNSAQAAAQNTTLTLKGKVA
jgi:hypothetical protein